MAGNTGKPQNCPKSTGFPLDRNPPPGECVYMDQNAFDDLFSLEEWLLAGPAATASRLASRASLFVLPVIFDSDRFLFAEVFGALALSVLRAHLAIPLTLGSKIPSQLLHDVASY